MAWDEGWCIVAIAVNDIVQVVDFQTYQGQQILNVWHFRAQAAQVDGANAINELLTAFIGARINLMRVFQSPLLVHTTLEGLNLSNGIDTSSVVVNLTGSASATLETSAVSFLCYTFRLLRSSGVVRNGYKRIGGVSEGLQSGNTNPVSSDITAFANSLNDDILAGLLYNWRPVILKGGQNVPLVSPVYSDVAAGEYRGLGSQNTRKAGRGS